jgi:N-acetylated-alpha-linked acidic dipeptidase
MPPVFSIAVALFASPLVAASAWSTQGAAVGAAPVPAESAPPSRAMLFELTQQPRVAGTIGTKVGAKICADWLEAAGWQVEIDEREVMLSLPRRIELEVRAAADGDVIHRRSDRYDPDAIPPGDLPMCNAWSASGEVTAPVVDVGRGLRADFEKLKAAGVELRGTIALARYGGAYRGIKVDLATQYGCVGVLLFQEKSKQGDVWPLGPWKPGHDAERGSISPIGRTPGDPSTPGWPSPKPGEKAKRLAGAELAAALPTIPCTPIGWAEAEKIQAHLAMREMVGAEGKPVPAPIGPGPAVVRMMVDQPRDVRTIQNVIARLPGKSEDCVIAGAHRDAWVRGANDDGSGVVAMTRAAQRLGEKARSGWKPANTIVIALWDAEEFGMIGSTEWGEANAEWIVEHCFAYVNSDTAVSGTRFRGASGTPGMLRVLKAALERVPTPEPRKEGDPRNLWEDWGTGLKPGTPAQIEPAGSGSDFAVFLHHLSRPVVDVSLSGNRAGQYHTAFDDFGVVDRYLDPGFVGHEMCGQLIAELLGEMAEQGRACFDAEEAALGIARIAKAAGSQKDPGTNELWLGPERAKWIVKSFENIAQHCGRGISLDDPDRSANIYAMLACETGIPGREWFRNPVWTPGLEDGYGSEYLPFLRAGVDDSPRFRFDDQTLGEKIESARHLLGAKREPKSGR